MCDVRVVCVCVWVCVGEATGSTGAELLMWKQGMGYRQMWKLARTGDERWLS